MANTKDPFILDTDASDVAIGGVLNQVQDGVERVIAFLAVSLLQPKLESRRAARSPSVPAPSRRTSPRKRPHNQSTGPIPKKTVHVEEPLTTRVVSSAEPRRGGIVVEVPRGSGPTSRSRSSRDRHCLIPGCTEVRSYAKPHAFNYHLPGVFDEGLPPAAIKVLRGRKEALLQAAVWLLRRAVDNLVEYVEMQHLLTSSSEKVSFADCQIVAMRAFCGYLSVPCPDNFTLEPMNSVAVLLHWKALLLIAARIPATEREYWRTLFPAPEEVGNRTPRAFDAHFHLDRTLKAMGLRLDSTFQSVLDGTRMDKGKEVIVAGTCTSFCDPETTPTTDCLKTLPADMEVAVGVHPKKRYSSSGLDRDIRKLKDLVRQRRVTAVGEVGLDHSVPPEYWPQQIVMLEKILPLVEPRHVLVLHCRGISGDSGAEAYLFLLHYVKKAVPENQRIYRHCFNGDSYVRDQWSSAFRNLYFGFTSMAAGFTPPQVRALKWINPERVFVRDRRPLHHPVRPQVVCTQPVVLDGGGCSKTPQLHGGIPAKRNRNQRPTTVSSLGTRKGQLGTGFEPEYFTR